MSRALFYKVETKNSQECVEKRCFPFLFQWLQMQFIVTSKHERKKPEICTTLPQNTQVCVICMLLKTAV